MKIINDISSIEKYTTPTAMTIGMFDGIHPGHQKIFKFLQKKNATNKSVVVTFENHPSWILKPTSSRHLVYPTKQKLKLLEIYSIDLVILLKFTKDLANQTFDYFLRSIYQKLPFSHLVLGHNSTFGKNKDGNKQNIELFSKEMNFESHYLSFEKYNNNIISSSKIRKALSNNDFPLASSFLGRNYSLYFHYQETPLILKDNNYYLLRYPLDKLHLPKTGVYSVKISTPQVTLQCLAKRKKDCLDLYIKDMGKLKLPCNIFITFEKSLL
jgi:riboflavin kinase / FMN adenylyltransferase